MLKCFNSTASQTLLPSPQPPLIWRSSGSHSRAPWGCGQSCPGSLSMFSMFTSICADEASPAQPLGLMPTPKPSTPSSNFSHIFPTSLANKPKTAGNLRTRGCGSILPGDPTSCHSEGFRSSKGLSREARIQMGRDGSSLSKFLWQHRASHTVRSSKDPAGEAQTHQC